MARDPDDVKVREYLRLLENPYASLQVGDDRDQDFATNATSSASQAGASSRESAQTPTPVELGTAPEPRHTSLPEVPHGNPYAALANIDDQEEQLLDAGAPSTGPALGEISKATFEAGCRRIFSQYIPRLERGRLRPEHRDFITRNRPRSARIRCRLLEELSRYDLSDLPGMRAQFNREDDRLTDKKLIEIEQAVDKDE